MNKNINNKTLSLAFVLVLLMAFSSCKQTENTSVDNEDYYYKLPEVNFTKIDTSKNEKVFPIEKNGNIGFVNINGELVIDYKFTSIMALDNNEDYLCYIETYDNIILDEYSYNINNESYIVTASGEEIKIYDSYVETENWTGNPIFVVYKDYEDPDLESSNEDDNFFLYDLEEKKLTTYKSGEKLIYKSFENINMCFTNEGYDKFYWLEDKQGKELSKKYSSFYQENYKIAEEKGLFLFEEYIDEEKYSIRSTLINDTGKEVLSTDEESRFYFRKNNYLILNFKESVIDFYDYETNQKVNTLRLAEINPGYVELNEEERYNLYFGDNFYGYSTRGYDYNNLDIIWLEDYIDNYIIFNSDGDILFDDIKVLEILKPIPRYDEAALILKDTSNNYHVYDSNFKKLNEFNLSDNFYLYCDFTAGLTEIRDNTNNGSYTPFIDLINTKSDNIIYKTNLGKITYYLSVLNSAEAQTDKLITIIEKNGAYLKGLYSLKEDKYLIEPKLLDINYFNDDLIYIETGYYKALIDINQNYKMVKSLYDY